MSPLEKAAKSLSGPKRAAVEKAIKAGGFSLSLNNDLAASFTKIGNTNYFWYNDLKNSTKIIKF